MTLWRAGEVVIVGIAAVLGGAALGVAVAWTLAQLGRRFGTDDAPVPTAPLPRFGKLTPLEVDQVLGRAQARRQRAADRHGEGHAIESGDPQSPIHLVEKIGQK